MTRRALYEGTIRGFQVEVHHETGSGHRGRYGVEISRWREGILAYLRIRGLTVHVQRLS